MLESFFPLIALFLIYTAIAAMSKTAKKASGARKSASPARSAAPADTVPEEAPVPETATPHFREMQPTIRLSDHDDSVYMGSLNAVTGEGYDPCHDEQLKPLTQAETIEPASATASGLQLHWSGDEIVRGFVVSEIMKRKGA